MTRIWLSGIAISVAAHLAVAGVLFLALDLQPAGQQPEPGTRLNVSTVDVAHMRAVPRPLPQRALPALPAAGTQGRSRALAVRPAPERGAIGRVQAARVPEALALSVGEGAGVPVAALRPAAARAVAEAPSYVTRQAVATPAPSRSAVVPEPVRVGARAPAEARGLALDVSGPALSGRSASTKAAPARIPVGYHLAARPAAAVLAASSPLPLAAIGANGPAGQPLGAVAPQGRRMAARLVDNPAQRAVVPAGVIFDARPLLPVAPPRLTPAVRRSQAAVPGGRAQSPVPLPATRAGLPDRPITRAPRPLSPRAARSPAARIAVLSQLDLPVRRAPPMPRRAQPLPAAAPRTPPHLGVLLWSGTAAPDPDSLTALRALSGATGTDALVTRAEIERVLTEQPCSRVQARRDTAGPRVILRGHVPDLRAAGALMAALRAPLGRDVALGAEIATLPRPLCEHVAGIAALGLRPRDNDAPETTVGPAIQSGALQRDAVEGVLRLAVEETGVVHVDLYDAAGGVTHLHPQPGTLPARAARGDALPLRLPDRAGQGPSVLAVMVTSRPLYSGPRAGREDAATYLRFLGDQAEAMRRAPGLTGRWRYAILLPEPVRE